jgi:hypothetical protein
VRGVEAPVWVVHGTDDLIIPFRMGGTVFDAAKRPGKMLPVEGAGHNDVADVGGETYWAWLTAALGAADRRDSVGAGS